MLRRCRRDPERLDARFLPPIQLDDRPSTAFLHERSETKRHDPGGIRMRPCETPHRLGIEMVVMIVRLQDDIEWWHVFERDPRRDPTPRAGKSDWRCPLAPHRVGENVETVELDEQTRVPNPRYRELRPRRTRRDKVGRD